MENLKPIERGGVTRMAGEDRRQQILNIAIRLFSQRGFRGATTKEIAQAAGVSEAIIFRHFATKQDLYAAILEHKARVGKVNDLTKLLTSVEESGDDRAIFEKMAREMFRIHQEDFEFFRLLLFSALEGHEFSQMFRERYVRQNCELIDAYLRERQRAGALRDIEPMVIARAFYGMIVHHSLVNLLLDPTREFLNISDEEAAQKFTDILINGIGAKTSESAAAKKRRTRAARKRKRTRKTKTNNEHSARRKR
jgi:AcrR family transcriptional regulator